MAVTRYKARFHIANMNKAQKCLHANLEALGAGIPTDEVHLANAASEIRGYMPSDSKTQNSAGAQKHIFSFSIEKFQNEKPPNHLI